MKVVIAGGPGFIGFESAERWLEIGALFDPADGVPDRQSDSSRLR